MGLWLPKKVTPQQVAAADDPVSLKGSGWWSFAWWSTATNVTPNVLDATAVAPSFGEDVRTVKDQSGNANDFTGGGAGLEATWENVGTGVLDFLGSNESYNFDAQVPLFHGDSTRSRFEFWTLVLVDRDSVDQTIFQYNDTDVAGDDAFRLTMDRPTFAVQVNDGADTATHLTGSTFNDAAWHIIAGYYDGTNVVAHYDGAETSTPVTTGPTTAANQGRWGARTAGTQFTAMQCLAIFFVSGGNLTAAERTSMSTFLEGLKP